MSKRLDLEEGNRPVSFGAFCEPVQLPQPDAAPEDPLYRLTSASHSGGAVYAYTYDPVGNRLSMTSPGGSTSYTCDAANRLTSAGGLAYTWDANGNLLSDGVRNYSYDHANRLIQVTEGILTTQFAYNVDGVRVDKVVGGATTDYLLDLAATLPVVISDTDAVYVYGLDIIAEQMSQGRMYYMHDGLGSVRQLTHHTGQIATIYAYDPFGVPLSGGTAPNPYRFTGEAWDAEVELLYLRARYYQPATGRFVTRDPWPGDVWRPGTLNLYPYVTSNPVNYTDPSGLNGVGPGGMFPNITRVPTPPGTQERVVEMALMLLPGTPFGPLRFPLEMALYTRYGYSPIAAANLTRFMLLSWLLPAGPEVRYFGPYHSLTKDVMHSRALVEFRQAWRSPNQGNYELPWEWSYSIDQKGEGIESVLRTGPPFYTANLAMFASFGAYGSLTAEGQLDTVAALLGSVNLITIERAPGNGGMVRIEAHNVMSWRSLFRVPGLRAWFPPVSRELPIPGADLEQVFYWDEPMPVKCGLKTPLRDPTTMIHTLKNRRSYGSGHLR